jgi:hypothetical protein
MSLNRVTPSAFVSAHAPWSTSKADTAAQCPKKFHFSYVLKRKVESYNADALVGKAVHSIIEVALNGMSVEIATRNSMELHKLCTPERTRVLDMVPSVESFLRRFSAYCTKHGVRGNLLVEKKLAASYDDKALKFFDNSGMLRGVLDVGLCIAHSPFFVVIDHKTGSRRSLEYYAHQFEAYYYLIKVNYPEVTHVIPGIHWVQEGAIELAEKRVAVDDLDKLYNNVMTRLNQATVNTADFDKTKTGPLCNWCDNRAECPAYVLGNHDRHQENSGSDGSTA